MAHISSHIIPIHGPYMFHITSFGKGKHKGSGIIVDNIFKPMKSVVSSIFKKFAKPVAKKALESGIKNTGERLGKKISEKSGDLIMKKLAKARATPTIKTTTPKKE